MKKNILGDRLEGDSASPSESKQEIHKWGKKLDTVLPDHILYIMYNRTHNLRPCFNYQYD